MSFRTQKHVKRTQKQDEKASVHNFFFVCYHDSSITVRFDGDVSKFVIGVADL